MSEQKKAPQSNSSRTVVIVAVAVLIVVAIAGIVLAGRNAPPPETAVASTSVASATQSSSGSTPQATGSPTDPLPKNVVFDAGSDKLPAGSNEGLARFADAARSSASSVRLSARFLTGANKQRDQELAKARTGAIRHALEANGLNSGKMQVELVEMPDGSLTPDAGNRVDLTFR
jgi:outer membrane protein OmpA-like peptidoglycan-associated protein